MEIEHTLYLVSILILLAVYLASALYMFIKYLNARKSQVKSTENRLFLLYALFFTFLMVGRIFLFMFDFYLTDFNISDLTVEEVLIWKLGISFQMFGYAFLLILMEHRIMKNKDYYILSILYFIFYFIGMSLSDIEEAGVFLTLGTAFSIFIPIAYFYIGVKSDQRIRLKAFSIFFGFMIIFMALIMDTEPILIPLMEALQMTRIGVYTLINLLKTGAIVLFFLGFK